MFSILDLRKIIIFDGGPIGYADMQVTQ